METKDMDQLLDLGEIDLFLGKAKEKCEKKLRGKSFAGMEQDDVVQEVLIKVYRALTNYDRNKSKVSTYIDHVIENMVKDCFKKCGSVKNLSNVNALEIEDSYTGEYEELEKVKYSVHLGTDDLNFMEREFLLDIEYSEKLSPRERQVFLLHYKGYAKIEIAHKLGLTKARISQIWGEIIEKIR